MFFMDRLFSVEFLLLSHGKKNDFRKFFIFVRLRRP